MFEAVETPPMIEAALPVAYVPPDWEKALAAFLAEKQNHTGSIGTRNEYSRVLRHFFGHVDKTPERVTSQDVFGFAYGNGPDGRKPSASTISLRITVLSSLFRFLQRMDLVLANPADRVQRPKVQTPPPRGLDASEIKRLLAAIPDTPAGVRDKAIILTYLYTGRRRAEILGLRVGDLSRNANIYYTYRGKGGVTKTRELPAPAFLAIVEGLRANGRELADMGPEELLFNVSAHGFYLNLRRYLRNAKLPEAGVHLLRHTAAKLRRAAGESVEDVSSFLDHSNLAVTTIYLRRLEGDDDNGWHGVAALLA